MAKKGNSGGKVFFTTFLREKTGYVAFILVIIYFLLLIRSDIIQNDKLKGEKRALTKGIETERTTQSGLKVRMNALTKSSQVEKVAREKLGLIKRGEVPYKVIEK